MKRYGPAKQGDAVKCPNCGKLKPVDISQVARGVMPECCGEVMEPAGPDAEAANRREREAKARRPSWLEEDEEDD